MYYIVVLLETVCMYCFCVRSKWYKKFLERFSVRLDIYDKLFAVIICHVTLINYPMFSTVMFKNAKDGNERILPVWPNKGWSACDVGAERRKEGQCPNIWSRCNFGRKERDVGLRKESFYTCREKGIILMINTWAYSNRSNQSGGEKGLYRIPDNKFRCSNRIEHSCFLFLFVCLFLK